LLEGTGGAGSANIAKIGSCSWEAVGFCGGDGDVDATDVAAIIMFVLK
jgi:hypothetical protein